MSTGAAEDPKVRTCGGAEGVLHVEERELRMLQEVERLRQCLDTASRYCQSGPSHVVIDQAIYSGPLT